MEQVEAREQVVRVEDIVRVLALQQLEQAQAMVGWVEVCCLLILPLPWRWEAVEEEEVEEEGEEEEVVAVAHPADTLVELEEPEVVVELVELAEPAEEL